jgi:hypothetical protein
VQSGRFDAVVEVTDGVAVPILLCEVLVITATGLLNGRAHFLHWGVIQISLANLIVIALMLAVFALAVLVPFPHSRDESESQEATPDVRD